MDAKGFFIKKRQLSMHLLENINNHFWLNFFVFQFATLNVKQL